MYCLRDCFPNQCEVQAWPADPDALTVSSGDDHCDVTKHLLVCWLSCYDDHLHIN